MGQVYTFHFDEGWGKKNLLDAWKMPYSHQENGISRQQAWTVHQSELSPSHWMMKSHIFPSFDASWTFTNFESWVRYSKARIRTGSSSSMFSFTRLNVSFTYAFQSSCWKHSHKQRNKCLMCMLTPQRTYKWGKMLKLSEGHLLVLFNFIPSLIHWCCDVGQHDFKLYDLSHLTSYRQMEFFQRLSFLSTLKKQPNLHQTVTETVNAITSGSSWPKVKMNKTFSGPESTWDWVLNPMGNFYLGQSFIAISEECIRKNVPEHYLFVMLDMEMALGT